MEVWCAAYKPDQSDPSYSRASHIQVGAYQASRKDVSVIATDAMASADTQAHEVEIASEVRLMLL